MKLKIHEYIFVKNLRDASKKIITLLCCIGSTLLFAQNTSSISATEELPNWPVMLSLLNTSQISSGVLLDKIADFSTLTNYNTAQNNLSGREHFTQTISELYKASDQSRFISVTELKNRIAGTTNANSVDVGIINTTFHRLNFNDDNPSAGGLLFTNGRFIPIVTRPAFISKKIILASPLKDIVSGSSINFNFKTALIFNNGTTNIKNLTVKFDDAANAAVNIINNGTLLLATKNITYSTSGYKILKFTTTFSDNTIMTTFGKIYVTVLDANNQLKDGSTSLCTELLRERAIFPPVGITPEPFLGYTETSAVSGKTEYTVFYSIGNNAKKLFKPLIIVDGFDPKDKRKVQDCDCENDDKCRLTNSTYSVTYTTEAGETTPHITSTFNPKYESIEDSMNYTEIVSGEVKDKNLLFDLRELGYDVIIINNTTYTTKNQAGQTVTIDGGADYIERNALTLVSFIKDYIKPQQIAAPSLEQLVLIGPSMGGQITRYALAYMEKKFAQTNLPEWKHNTRLWVSVDSPHLGASIPVGAQANIWFMADPSKLDKQAAKDSYDELNSPAGQQQSITNFEYARTSSAHNLQGSPFFTRYYNALNTNGVAGSGGYPVSTSTFRKIAMINGSLSGLKQGTESQTFLYTRIYMQGFFPFQNSSINLARFRDSFMSGYGTTGNVFKGDGQTGRFSLHLLPPNCNSCFPHPGYNLNVVNNDIRGSLDVVPGGYLKVAEVLKEAIEGGSSISVIDFRSETTNYVEKNSFIASFSSLGHLYPNQSWSNPLNTNLTCPTNKQTPFDSYYGTAGNTEHTMFTKEGKDWLLKELAGDKQAPWFPIQDNLLTGSDTVCENTNTVFSFQDICKIPSDATWTVSNNLQIITSTGTSITVKRITDGLGTITATFQNGLKVTKTFWVGVPVFNIVRDHNENCDTKYHYVNFEINLTNQNVTDLEFIYNTPNVTYTYNGNNLYTFRFPKGYTGNFNLDAIATNSCGSYIVESTEFIKICQSGSNNYHQIYPNPTPDIVNIQLLDGAIKPITTSRIIAELYDLTGQQKRNVEIVNDVASINISGLQIGIYLLKINIDGEIETHQVIIQ